MNKEQKAITAEYAASLPDDELRELAIRLTERLQDDLALSFTMMAQNPNMDAMLYATNSGDELYRLTDRIRDVLVSEARKRKIDLKYGALIS